MIFNLFGVLWMVAVFPYFLKGIDFFMHQKHGLSILDTHLSESDYESVKNLYPVALAIFHTSFNIINTLLLIGFAPFIAKVATRMVPEKGEDDEDVSLKFINSGLFSTSELATIQARKEISTFGMRAERMFSFVQSLIDEKKPKKYYKLLARIEKYEQITDNLELEIAAYLTKISEGEISHHSSKKIRAMFKIIDDLESIGDAIYQLSKIIDNSKQNKERFTKHQNKSLAEMFDLLNQAFIEMNLNLEKGFKDVDIKKAYLIETKINEKRNLLRQQHVEDLKEKKYKHKTGTFYSDMFSVSERIGDYIINVSEAILEYQESE